MERRQPQRENQLIVGHRRQAANMNAIPNVATLPQEMIFPTAFPVEMFLDGSINFQETGASFKLMRCFEK